MLCLSCSIFMSKIDRAAFFSIELGDDRARRRERPLVNTQRSVITASGSLNGMRAHWIFVFWGENDFREGFSLAEES